MENPAFCDIFSVIRESTLESAFSTIRSNRPEVLRALIARLMASCRNDFLLSPDTYWFVVWETTSSKDRSPTILGCIEVFEEREGRWSFGHIDITADRKVAQWLFRRVRSEAETHGRIVDDLHPDHEWYACQRAVA